MNSHEYFKLHPAKLTKKERYESDLHILGGNMVMQIRFDKGLTQAQLAKKCGLRQPAIARIENYSYVPSVRTLYKIAYKCGYKLKIEVEKIK